MTVEKGMCLFEMNNPVMIFPSILLMQYVFIKFQRN